MNPKTASTRRDFAKISLGASLGWLAGLGAPQLLPAATTTDYKALVCIYLFGGNDGHNTVIPIDDVTNINPNTARYKSIRGSLALPTVSAPSVIPLNKPKSDPYRYGLHGSLTKVAEMFNNGTAAIIPNMGIIDAPLTKADIAKDASLPPPNIGSHVDQLTLVQCGSAKFLTAPAGAGAC